MLYLLMFLGQNKLPFHYGHCATIRQIREFSTFSVNSALKHILSVRCAIATSGICIFLDFLPKTWPPLRTLSLHGKMSRFIVCFSLILF
jgi:hypothetical protein